MTVDVDALLNLSIEKGIGLEQLISSIEVAVTEKYKELPGHFPQGRAVFNRETGDMVIHVPQFNEEGIYTETVTDRPDGFDDLVNAAIRREVKQRIRAANDAVIVHEYSTNVGDVISGIVLQGRDETIVYVDLGKTEGKIPPQEQIAGEKFVHGDRLKAFVVDVKQGLKGPEITLSRTHPGLVKALFALEVPEIRDGVVEIVNVSREAGNRSKVAVRAHRLGVSPKGALIGPGGARAKLVTEALGGEKIDIVDYSEDIGQYVANALAPAKVVAHEIVDLELKSVKITVPDYQLSLAIGKDGQNARLAARLTGAKIDIHPDKPIERVLSPRDIAAAEAKAEALRLVEEEKAAAAEAAALQTAAILAQINATPETVASHLDTPELVSPISPSTDPVLIESSEIASASIREIGEASDTVEAQE